MSVRSASTTLQRVTRSILRAPSPRKSVTGQGQARLVSGPRQASSSASSSSVSGVRWRTGYVSLAIAVVATAVTHRTVQAESPKKRGKAQVEDEDRAVAGAKPSSRAGTRAIKEDLRAVALEQEDGKEYITMAEVARHNLAHDAWVVVDGEVYDVTNFHPNHPGGSKIIVSNAGQDVTALFKPIHPPHTLENNLPPESYKGMINPEEAAKHIAAWQAEQDRVENGRAALPDVETLLGLDELQNAAESFLSPRVVDYYGAAALDGVSLERNRNDFRKCRLVPRVMRDVSSIRPQTKIFGYDSPLPIYVSPASNALLGHPDGELNITRGAAKTGVVQGVSAASSFSLTEILDEKAKMDDELGRKMGMVYQVYVQSDRERTKAQVREAVDAGVQALVLTVDTNVLDHRQTTEKIKGTTGDAEPGVKMGAFTDFPAYHDARLNWDDIKWLKVEAQGTPIYLKGVCHIDDVRLAKKHKLQGCILSNHGGRQLDQARSGFESLRAIHAEDPQLLKDIEVYVDGGVRRGTDVLQAIAFGARGVGLGRPFLWSQAAYGEKGVIRAVRILESEIVTAMRLLGVTSIDQVNPSMVECLAEIWK